MTDITNTIRREKKKTVKMNKQKLDDLRHYLSILQENHYGWQNYCGEETKEALAKMNEILIEQ